MKLKSLFFAALLGLAGSAFAAVPAPTAGTAMGGMHHGMDMCKEHAQECKDAAAKFDKWCAANADKCVAVKAWNEKRIEYCSAHERECMEHHHHMMEHMKDWCSKHPDKDMCNKKESHEDMNDEDAPPPK